MKRNSLMLIAAFVLAALFAACTKDSSYLIDEVLDVNNDAEAVRIMKQHISVPGTDQTVDLIVILKGDFIMGADYFDPDAYSYEQPQHKVTISRDFAFAEVPVTQALYEAVMDTNPARTMADSIPSLRGFFGADKPIVWVSYEDALEFCRRLSSMTGRTFSLPTEAQWEYVARGGHAARRVQTIFAGDDRLDTVGWYLVNTPVDSVAVIDSLYDEYEDTTIYDTTVYRYRHIMPVRGKKPNIIGVYDLCGNVWEWCLDYFNYFTEADQVDPQGLDTVTRHPDGHYEVYHANIRRGGSWNDGEEKCRITYRFPHEISPFNFTCDSTIGFRVVMEL